MSGFKQSINIKGLSALGSKLNNLSHELQQKVARRATGTMAAMVRDEAKAKVHIAKKAYIAGPKSGPKFKVDPGHVGRNIIMKYIPEGERKGKTSEHIVTVSNSQDGAWGAKNIGVFVEYGINMDKPYPFMRPAFDAKKNEAVQAAESVIKRELQKIWTKN